jgi:hypothetical protein
MVTREEVMPMLLTVCPSFAAPWRDYVDNPIYEEGQLYIDLAEFASHLVGLQKAGETSEFQAVFRVVEAFHLDGDAFVREAATIGLLEDIQNVARNRNLDPESFYPYLHPESAKWWRKLNAFWNGDFKALRE